MRVVLVGLEAARRRLRAQLGDDMEVTGEAATLESARTAGFEADAWLIAPDGPAGIELAWDPPVEALTPRERDVFELVGDGLSNRAIAGKLAISDQTVKFHVASICAKLGAANRTDAVRRALRLGLLTL
jgi:ATP/maltotriose-dependent transcriptional regulator MalT